MSPSPDRLSLLLLSQGGRGPILGHVSVADALRHGLAAAPDVDAWFHELPPWTVANRLFAAPLPGLHLRGLDAHAARAQLVDARAGRRVLARLVAERRPDVVHIDSHVAGLLAPGPFLGTAVLLSVDVPVAAWEAMTGSGRWAERLLAPTAALERRAFSRAATVLTRSAWAAGLVRALAPQAHVRVLHPGLDLSRFRPGTRTARDRPRLLFVGGRFQAKGGHDLLAALGERLGTDVELDVVTREPVPLHPGLRRHTLAPGDPQLVALHQQADLTVLPSYRDSFGIALLESMACGTPVIGSDVGAVPELLGTDGLVVPAGDVRALRAAITAVLDAPGPALARAGSAVDRITRRFDAVRQARELTEVARAAAGKAVSPVR